MKSNTKSYSLQQRFDALCQITRAAHFEWRQTYREMHPEENIQDALLKYWEIVGRDTARAYLRRIDPGQPVAPQIARMITDSSLSMGETAEWETNRRGETLVRHTACPWFDWHKRYDALKEDRPGCDCWFRTIVEDINKALGTRLRVETLGTLPDGDQACVRRLTED